MTLRRDIQAEVLLSGDAKALRRLTFPSGGLSLGLSPDDEDYAALLRAWHKREEETGTNTEMWETLLQMARGREGLSPSVREAAEATVRGKTERFALIERFDQPIALWRDPDHEKWLAERAAERDNVFISHRAQIEKYLTDIDAGSAVLAEVADAYLGRCVYVNDLSGEMPDKMAQFLTPRLAQRVLAGFVASLSRTDLPSARQISKCHAQNIRYSIEGVLIAGIAEMLRLNQPLSKIPRANLESAFMAWRRDPASNTEDPLGVEVGLAKTILDAPEAYERFYRTSIEPQLEANREHIYDLYDLTHKALLWSKPWMVSIAARLSREWLSRFPMLRATTVGNLVTPLLANSLSDIRELAHVNREQVCADIDALFFWLGIDFIADFKACEAHLLDAADDNPDFLWILQMVVEPPVGLRLSDMSVEQLSFIIRSFSPHWPFSTRPDQTTHGHRNPWDATDFITRCIATLSAIPTTAAATSLSLLVETIDFGYKDEIKHAHSQQRRAQADHDYFPADIDTLKATTTGALPTTVDDLRAFFGDQLTVLQSKLNGDNLDSWVVYWDRDRPHNENYCRDRFINQVSGELPAAITFGPEEQMPGITRADIGLRLKKLMLPIEIKGQWHSDVWAAASEQLDGQYTRDWRADGRGVYLVLWFGDVPGYNLPLHPEKIAAPETPDRLRSMLIDRIPPERRPFLDVYILDVSGTVEGRARLAVGRQRKRRTK